MGMVSMICKTRSVTVWTVEAFSALTMRARFYVIGVKSVDYDIPADGASRNFAGLAESEYHSPSTCGKIH
jgi:hypothetical protein